MDRLRGRIRVGEHKTGEPPGKRRLADPFPAPDQPGVREAALAIGRQHFHFCPFVADQRIDVARMGRASERVGFGKIVGLGFLHAELGLERARRMEPALDCRPYGRGDVVFASIRVDERAAQRLGRSDVEECPPKGFMKRQPL